MREPKRWVEDHELSEPIRELLRAGSPPPPMPGAANADLLAVAQALMTKGAVSTAIGAGATSKAVATGAAAKTAGAGTTSKAIATGAAAKTAGFGAASHGLAAQGLGARLLGLKALGTMLVAGGVTSAGVVGYGLVVDSTDQSAPRTEQTAQHQRSATQAAIAGRTPRRADLEPQAAASAAKQPVKQPVKQNTPGSGAAGYPSDMTGTLAAEPRTGSDRKESADLREPLRDSSFPTAASVGPLPSASFSSETLAHEAELLLLAREQLPADPQKALDLAAEHRRLHPNGQLGADRELIAVDALVRLGRREDARRLAEPLIAASPTGIYARRLRSLLEGSAQP